MINLILKLLIGKSLGLITRTFIKYASNLFIKDILNDEFQKKAIEFVIELDDNTEMTNSEKVKSFNRKMKGYLKIKGVEVKDSIINCLREMAVIAVKNLPID